MFQPVVAIIRYYHSTHLRLFYTVPGVGVFDEEISKSRCLLEHSTNVLGMWVNHVIIHKKYRKNIILYYQKHKQET